MGEPVDSTFMKPAVGTLRIFDDVSAIAESAAEFVCELACRKPGPVRIALAGGDTPKPLYERFAQEQFIQCMPWERVHWLFGDERFVPPSSADSNYGMARRTFLEHVPAPTANVHPIKTKGFTPDEAARAYEETLKDLYGAQTLSIDRPLLDITLLGIGSDGHTASLLPGEPILSEYDSLGRAGTARPPRAAHQPHLPRAQQQPRGDLHRHRRRQARHAG